MPWGRASEDVVTKKRERLGHMHMTSRLEKVTKVINTQPPKTSKIDHLANRAKKQQLIVARQRVIDFENKKLVDSMASIMRGEGPPVHPYREYQKGTSKTAVERKMIRQRIELENQFIADRLRNRIEPVISRDQHAKDYARNTRVRKNISQAHKRDLRTKRFQQAQLRKQAMEDMAATMAGNTTPVGYEAFDRSQMTTSLTSLRTASDVRRQIAEDRNVAVPDYVISSRSAAPKQRQATSNPYRLQLHHNGSTTQSVQSSSLPRLDRTVTGTLESPGFEVEPQELGGL